jgi:hypothetical protein
MPLRHLSWGWCCFGISPEVDAASASLLRLMRLRHLSWGWCGFGISPEVDAASASLLRLMRLRHLSWDWCVFCLLPSPSVTSAHVQLICITNEINQPTRRNSFTNLLLDVYVQLNMFRASLRPSSGAYKCTRSLWFYRWRVAVEALLAVRPRPTTLQPPLSNGKTRGSSCGCMLLMMGGMMPKTCWATHKRQVINLWNCCILLVNYLNWRF